MLEALHTRGFLKKVPTSGVIMTPTKNDTVLLSELNQLIAEQKGTTVDQLAITDGVNPNPPTRARNDPTRTTSSSINEDEQDLPKVQAEAPAEDLSPAQMRSKADALFKQAQILRKKADEVDPPKSKKKSLVVEA